jgi:hypothetical protein
MSSAGNQAQGGTARARVTVDNIEYIYVLIEWQYLTLWKHCGILPRVGPTV